MDLTLVDELSISPAVTAPTTPENIGPEKKFLDRISDMGMQGLSSANQDLLRHPMIFPRFVQMRGEALPKNIGSANSESAFDSGMRILIHKNVLTKGWNSWNEKSAVKVTAKNPEVLADQTCTIDLLTDTGKLGADLSHKDAVYEIYFGEPIPPTRLGENAIELLKDLKRPLYPEDKMYLQQILGESVKLENLSMGRLFTLLHVRALESALLSDNVYLNPDQKTKILYALCHHLSAGVYPEGINPTEDLAPDALHLIAFLEVYDKYQAFIERSKMAPEIAYEMTKKTITNGFEMYVNQNPDAAALKQALVAGEYVDRCMHWLDFLYLHQAEFIDPLPPPTHPVPQQVSAGALLQ